MVESDHPRLILHNLLPLHLCKELEFIHKSCCTVGYRPNVFSTTLSHLIATNCGHLILPFVSIRERLKEKVEEFFGCEYELFIEFTGLISWTKGSSIGWHSDDNRSYLKQRDFAAVCYLNSYGKEFNGGLFHFQDGEPQTVVPAAGDAIMYTADSRNIHSVDEIIDGERLTLTLWFSRDSQHDEDAKLISRLSQTRSSGLVESVSHLPLPASSNMYWFSPGDSPNHQPGFDIRLARVHIFGYVFCLLDDEIHKFTSDSSFDLSELLMKPLWLARVGQMFNKQFVNSLHALQVVQFYCWKEFELQTSDRVWEGRSASQLIRSQPETSIAVELVHPNDLHLAKLVFHCVSYDESMQKPFSWEVFSTAVSAWEDYTSKLQNELLASLPYWKTHQSIFPISSLGITEDHIDFSKCP